MMQPNIRIKEKALRSGETPASPSRLMGEPDLPNTGLRPLHAKSYYFHAEVARENLRKARDILAAMQHRLDRIQKNPHESTGKA